MTIAKTASEKKIRRSSSLELLSSGTKLSPPCRARLPSFLPYIGPDPGATVAQRLREGLLDGLRGSQGTGLCDPRESRLTNRLAKSCGGSGCGEAREAGVLTRRYARDDVVC